ncbi:MAG: ABC transporter ATP-binding protein [Acidimicrobiia bacterium]
MSDRILEIDDVTLQFGNIVALESIRMSVREGELLSIIGPNGAGKTSLFNCISGVYRPRSGEIRLDGLKLSALAPHAIAKAGIARTFQNVEVFPNMTVLDNLLLGCNQRMRAGVLACCAFWGRAIREETEQRLVVEEIIEFLEIEHLRREPVGALPHGLQKRVELGRALAMQPRVLLLDEPVAGMNQEETEDIVRFILDVREELEITIVLVEHDMGVVMDVSDTVAVLDFGRLIACGPPAEVAADPAVISAYLGGGDWAPQATVDRASGFPLPAGSR